MTKKYQHLTGTLIASIDNQFRNKAKKIVMYELLDYLHEIEFYWPTNIRHCYYKMLSRGFIEADKKGKRNNYQKMSRYITELRDHQLLPWDAVGDAGRRTIDKAGKENIQEFAESQLRAFLNPDYYYRCRAQGQEYYIEILTEKEALAAVFEEVVRPYCIRITVAKGQNSATKVNEMAERMKKAFDAGQQPIVLCFNDLDPTGWAIPYAIRARLKDVHGLDADHVTVHRAGINREDINGLLVDSSFEFKSGDNNLARWLSDFTNLTYSEALNLHHTERSEYAEKNSVVKPVELDAMDMPDLEKMITDSIEEHLDMEEYEFQQQEHIEDRIRLKEYRIKARQALKTNLPELFGHG